MIETKLRLVQNYLEKEGYITVKKLNISGELQKPNLPIDVDLLGMKLSESGFQSPINIVIGDICSAVGATGESFPQHKNWSVLVKNILAYLGIEENDIQNICDKLGKDFYYSDPTFLIRYVIFSEQKMPSIENYGMLNITYSEVQQQLNTAQ